MKYFIDTANQEDINKWIKYVDGVTCNPIILNKSDLDAYTFYKNNDGLFDNIFIQINRLDDANELVYKEVDKQKVIFKVPLLRSSGYDGYYLMQRLLQLGCRTCSTIVYDISQFNYACEVGSEYSIVLYAKNDNKKLVEECCELKYKKGFGTKVVAASFRNTQHVFDCINAGADYATVPPKIMSQLFHNEQVIEDYYTFYGLETWQP